MFMNAEDRICGVERYPLSHLWGQIVCPTVNLWQDPRTDPGVGVGQRTKIDELPHNTPVLVSESIRHKGEPWYRVRSLDDEHQGWVSSIFLQTLGENAYPTIVKRVDKDGPTQNTQS